MAFTVWRRHNRDVCTSTNRYEPRCGCPLWVQFVWKGAPGVFEGKKLTYANKRSLGTRSWSEAQSKVKDLEKRLKNFAEGKVVPKGTTVEAALQDWYEFRDQEEELAPSPDLEAPTALRDLMAAVEADGLSPKGFLWVSSPQEVSVPRRSLLRLVTSVAPRNPR